MTRRALVPLLLLSAACSGGDDATSPSSASPDGAVTDSAATIDASNGSDGGALTDATPDARDASTEAAPDGSIDWSVLHPELVTWSASGASLSMRATQRSLWYQASQGPLVYRMVTGGFTISARVRARSAANASSPPTVPIHLGGLMARNPTGAQENYVFIVAGYDENDLSVETKTTLNNVSSYVGPAWGSGDAELRLCRVGSTFRLYKRAIGASTWTLATTYERTDLPATLQVGANIYAAANTPDLRVDFEDVAIAAASAEADCTR